MKNRAWSAYLGLGALGGLAYYFFPLVGKSGPFFNVLGASSVAAILVGIRLHRPKKRLPWYLFAAGQALFIMGDVITYNYPRLFGTEIPFPSIGDFFYLSVYPCLTAGILILIRSRTPGRDRDSLIDSMIVAIGLGLLSWEFLMAPYARDYTLTAPVKLVSIAYPFMDVLLLAVVVRLTVGLGLRARAFYLLVFAAVALLVTDAAYGMIQLSGVIYENGGPLEAGWLSFYLLWGAAALHPSMRTLSDPPANPQRQFRRGRLVLLACASLMAPAVQIIQVLRGEDIDMPVIVGSISLFVLAIARMNILVRKHELAETRERALREAAASFVAATGREGIVQAAIQSMESLIGGGCDIRLAMGDGDELAVVAGNGEWAGSSPIPLLSLPPGVRTDLARGRLVVAPVDPGLADVLGISHESNTVTLAPMEIHETTAGLAIVVSGSELSGQIQDGLRGLASQIALALEGELLTEDLHRRKSEARFTSLVQNSSDVTTIMAADTTVRYVSPSVLRVMGYEPEQLAGSRLLDTIHPDDVPRVMNVLVGGSQDGHPEVLEFRWRHRDGTWLNVETLVSDLTHDPEVGGIVLNTRDISERKAFEEQLTHQAFHDSITGLANRALFRDRVEHALERQQRDDRPVAVLFMDIDDFKTINDSLGHAAGDHLLGAVGERIRGCLRAADTAARLGGDEFGILLEDAGHDRAAEIAHRIQKILEDPVTLDGKEVFVRASLGIAIGDEDRKGARGTDELLRNADVAMYMAKAQGKGRYQLFEPQMHEGVLERMELKADLQRAVEHHEFELFYQPVVYLESGELSGLEALVRWRHPQKGLIAPLEFIPLAEETGLIVRLGKWILEEACRQAVQLQEQFPKDPPLSMSVNLSMRQLQHAGLIEEVAHALRVSGLPAQSLIIEITETAMMQDTEMAILRLNQLKDLGVRLAIDDFGTGYSSLNYLRRFPVDILKVDKSFIEEVHQGGEQSALTASIIQLAGTLQLVPVAEGIEQEVQLRRLLELRCVLGQGFYFAEPLDSDGITRLVASASAREDGRVISSTN